MKWEKVSLGDVVTFRGGGTPRKDVQEFWSNDIPWATVKDFRGLCLSCAQDSISRKGLESSSANLIPAGHVIIPTRMALGKAAINTIDIAINQDLRALIPKKPLEPKYLLHSILGLADIIVQNGSGATVKGITQEKLAKLKIPLPPLSEQKRIAKILDAAAALRAKRRESIAQLDALIQSTFLDMFGDPVTNPKGWEMKPLDKLGDVQTGSTPPSKKDGMFGGTIPFITPGDLKETWVESSRTVTKSGSMHSRTVDKGATLVCCIGATIGKMGKASEFSAFNQQINSVSWGNSVADGFGLEAMKFFKAKIASDDASTTLPILKKSLFQKICIPHPPLPLQHHFASIVESIERQKARLRAHLAELDTLFASLQHRAFNGDL